MLGYLKRVINIILISTLLFILTNFSINIIINYENNRIAIKEKNISINNLPISYYQEGNGFPLLIINDLISSNLELDYVKKDLSKHYEVIILNTYELSKYLPKNYSSDNLSDLIIEFMNNLGHNKFNIISLGINSNIVLNTAIKYTNNINKIILCNPTEYTYNPNLKHLYIAQYYLYSKNYSNKSMINKNIFEYNYFLLNNISNTHLYKYIDISNKQTWDLHNISNEILILSTLPYIEYSKELDLKIKNSTLKEVLNCGKYIHIEASKIFSKEIVNFLS